MAKPHVDPGILSDLLSLHFPDPGPLTPLIEGEESRAFAFNAGGEPYVVRINTDRVGFEKDRLAHLHLGSALPVPEVVLLVPFGDGQCCVSRRLPGQTLQALPRGGAYAYGASVTELLDAMASVDPGALAASGLFAPEGQSWAEFLRAPGRWSWGKLDTQAMAVVARCIGQIDLVAASIGDPAGLVHGDFGSNNVLVLDGRITGLIDWSEATLGDPLYDLANILFWRSWLDCMDQQCRYFEAEQPQRLADRATLTAYQLRIGLETLRDAREGGDATVSAWALDRCATLLALKGRGEDAGSRRAE